MQRSSADGLGRFRASRRKRRDGERRAAGEVDIRQHRRHEETAPVARLRDRLGAGACDLLATVLPLEPVAVPAHARARPGLQEDRHGELGPGRQDGTRQRAGDRRPRLAHRGARREAGDPDVLHADHRLRRGAARRARLPHRLARAGEDDAGQLDRQEPRRQYRLCLRAGGREEGLARVHHARRHADGGHLLRRGRGASACRARGQVGQEARRFRRGMQARLGDGGRSRPARQERHADGALRHASDHGRENRGLGGQLRPHGLRRRRGDGRARPRRARF